MVMMNKFSRRQILRGTVHGAAVMVGLPMLDCFLNTNGTAFADGKPLPTRFLTWFWGLGFNPGRWEPQAPGLLAGQKLGPEAAALEAVKEHINVYSMLKVFLDGRANVPHQTGWHGQLMGMVPKGGGLTFPTVDTLVADAIGNTTRFRMLVASNVGAARSSVTYLPGGVQVAAEMSPAALYARIFGADFKDPNSTEFKPDPRIMAKQSVLSAIKVQRSDLLKSVGTADRARLDEYFSSLRQIEKQVALQLEKPAPIPSCTVAKRPEEVRTGTELDDVQAVNKLNCEILAHALACDQTRVASICASNSVRLRGDSITYHTYTHQEPFDSKLGYQPKVSFFATRLVEGLTTLVQTLAQYKEGDGTLLDRSLVLATTDCGSAHTHQVENIPIITAGRAGGRMKTGLHVRGSGDAATRVGLTVMQAMGMAVGSFGQDSNETSRSITEVLA